MVHRQLFDKLTNLLGTSRAVFKMREVKQLTIAEPSFGAQNVVHHVAVGNRAAAARVVAGHAAQSGLRAG